ncbi:MAG: thioredoxin [Syntrophomonadaceae bacterium]|nr:thioredoxin [Syntrophomonadaceae bacterium]
MGRHSVDVSDHNFQQEVIDHDLPVLVDFWAGWCGPCKMIGPVIEEIAAEYKDRIKVVKVDVDREQRVAGELGVRSIPTLVMFRDGREVRRIVGYTPKAELKKIIDQQLA